ncbi:polymorphic outer membrane protein middle domain-containing protein [Chlamydia sp. 17-3921]|uniref:polymorphic outer membrane protein middle domain-containing protein n=1 Tax=Chlamydia sp. 17-3921 TaxID=2675798 RepID=UPI001918C50C|nr:polymorphic outer membrane protein middle domain-containing protein [Chlamydia sp. 17-3921]
MKPSSSWLFFSPALFFFSLNFSAQAANVDLKESFDGTENTIYSPKETSDAEGTTYTLLNDISIYSAGIPTPLEKSCFNDTAGHLSFLGQGHSLIFNTIDAGAHPTAIKTTTDKNLTLSGFYSLTFKNAPASTVTTGSGAATSGGGLTISKVDHFLALNNFSTNDGGAFKAKYFSLSGTKGNITFQGNTSDKQGGAVSSETTLTLQENLGSLIFTNNSAKESGGGALSSKGSTDIERNGQIFFINNSTTGENAHGGAINSFANGSTLNPELKFEENASINFSYNSAEGNGGAIYAKKLFLIANGPTEFLFNKSGSTTNPGKGGAIAIAPKGSLVLSADKGDISFLGNTIIVDATNVKRSAINLEDDATISMMAASAGNNIFFYDPITHSTTPTSPPVPQPQPQPTVTASAPASVPTTTPPSTLLLNPSDADGTIYTGSIVFSGEKLNAEETAVVENLVSTIKSPVKLANGKLVLKKGVTVKLSSLTQDEQATVVMDTGTTLEATSDDISLNRLNINLSSLSNGKKATVKTPENKNITITGPVGLVDEYGDFYEDHTLRNPQMFSLLEVSTSGTGVASVAAIPLTTSLDPSTHYGYQGYWSLDWTTTGTTKSATVSWTKTGYTPNSERNTSLVPNSLWGNVIDMRSIHGLMKNHTQHTYLPQSVWISGITNFYHQDRRRSRQGFRHLSGGYALGGNKIMPSDDLLSVAFCQLSGRDKDHVVTKNHSDTYGATLYYQHTTPLFNILNTLWGKAQTTPKILSTAPQKQNVILNAHLTYTHTDNHMKTHYTRYSTAHGSWRNNNFGIEVGANLAPKSLSSSWQIDYSPFVNAQYIYGRQQRFQERASAESRGFEPSKLVNFSIPMGMRFERQSKISSSKQSLALTYSIDAYRQNPDNFTTLLVSRDSWETLGANPARQTISTQITNHSRFNPFLEMFCQFAFEFRGSSRLYNFDIGTSFVF